MELKQEELDKVTEKNNELTNSLSGIELLAEKRLEKLNALKEKENSLRFLLKQHMEYLKILQHLETILII